MQTNSANCIGEAPCIFAGYFALPTRLWLFAVAIAVIVGVVRIVGARANPWLTSRWTIAGAAFRRRAALVGAVVSQYGDATLAVAQAFSTSEPPGGGTSPLIIQRSSLVSSAWNSQCNPSCLSM